MVADGHLGVDAAAFIEAHFHRTLYSLIPPKLPDWENRKGEAPSLRSIPFREKRA